MSLRADEISTLIQKQIQGFEETVELKETGRVISVGDGMPVYTDWKMLWQENC